MIPELGQVFLVAALASALLQFLGGIGLFSRKNENIEAFIERITMFQTFSLLICFGLLTTAFLQDDFSVLYVASNSNTALPFAYKIAAVWGGHEGSLLLWVLILSIWTFLLSKDRALKSSPDLRIQSLSILGLISFGFLLFILYTSNPFERLLPSPIQGRGLNPLLQDPALVIHPPTLYAGYVGLAVPFSLAVSSLLTVNNHQWAMHARTWTVLSWVFLTGGIALGSWWAYYELGWGGWWFWDPVENASLMPWFLATALMHSLIVTEKRGIFNGFSTLLAITAFSLSLLGTFLVRSGVLISVHSFASDPQRGLFILGLLAFFSGSALIIYSIKQKKNKQEKLHPLSRESLLLLNNVFLCASAGLVLIGTVYPLILEMLDLGKISVGPPYFNFVILFPFIPLLFSIGVAVFSNWSNDSKNLINKVSPIILIALMLGFAFTFIYGWDSLLTLIGVFLALWTILTGISPLIKNRYSINKSTNIIPMMLGHIGLGIMILGITVTSSYGITFDDSMNIEQTSTVGDYEFKLTEIGKRNGPNYLAQYASIEISKNGQYVETVYPEKRVYDTSSMPMTEAGIEANLFRDLFIAVGEDIGGGSWSMHLQYKPLLRLIWYGPIIMILGGLIRVFLGKKQTERHQ
ncbi:MAG: heme lyase CcmF/NrfE family subunit [Gammaproteobacteria bacterium]|jgi:cytochrome c-type biogenesis protein CcmF|nr:c-type cytochrome biogenesis protein CcmF [Gammaproteobacteria bacterium]MDP6146681.1 heme lyase CcmF/NrfE family subunit [Gammaproteobacteria bacterium]HJL79618.1 heme lyase CcmF/NrfE family subunit [Gammaproteobacteria bacterium]